MPYRVAAHTLTSVGEPSSPCNDLEKTVIILLLMAILSSISSVPSTVSESSVKYAGLAPLYAEAGCIGSACTSEFTGEIIGIPLNVKLPMCKFGDVHAYRNNDGSIDFYYGYHEVPCVGTISGKAGRRK